MVANADQQCVPGKEASGDNSNKSMIAVNVHAMKESGSGADFDATKQLKDRLEKLSLIGNFKVL